MERRKVVRQEIMEKRARRENEERGWFQAPGRELSYGEMERNLHGCRGTHIALQHQGWHEGWWESCGQKRD